LDTVSATCGSGWVNHKSFKINRRTLYRVIERYGIDSNGE
jgi:hypothetical protein